MVNIDIRINIGVVNINWMFVVNIGGIVLMVNFIVNYVVFYVIEIMIKSRIIKKFFISIWIKYWLKLCNWCFFIDLLIFKWYYYLILNDVLYMIFEELV